MFARIYLQWCIVILLGKKSRGHTSPHLLALICEADVRCFPPAIGSLVLHDDLGSELEDDTLCRCPGNDPEVGSKRESKK